jgi:hypothetical protein
MFKKVNNLETKSVDCQNIIEDLSYLPPVTFTWNPGSLVDGAGVTSSDIVVPEAALGFTKVEAVAIYDILGVTCTAWVKSSEIVNVRLQNETGGVADLSSATANNWIIQARRI